MAEIQLRSLIEPAPGADGPYYVVTRSDVTTPGVLAVTNVTTGLASIAAALDQARTDQGAVITANSLTFVSANLATRAKSA